MWIIDAFLCKETWKKTLKTPIIWLMIIILALMFLFLPESKSHETEDYKHKALPPCHGWKVIDSNQRLCYLDKDQDMCVNAIYNHGLWHISEPFKCEEESNGKEKE